MHINGIRRQCESLSIRICSIGLELLLERPKAQAMAPGRPAATTWTRARSRSQRPAMRPDLPVPGIGGELGAWRCNHITHVICNHVIALCALWRVLENKGQSDTVLTRESVSLKF